MAAWTKLLTGFGKVLSKDVAKAAEKSAVKTATKTAVKTEVKNIEKAAVMKNPAVNTATKMYTQGPGESVLKNTAREIAGSKVVKVTGSVAGGMTLIGGGTYALGKLSGKGMEGVGYGIRDVTGNHTDAENEAENLKNRAKEQQLNQEQFDFLKNFIKWANENGYYDSPSVREAYNDLVGGGQSTPTTEQASSGSNIWLWGAGALAVAAGAYLYKTRKKKGKK
jgi:hypothetical protein